MTDEKKVSSRPSAPPAAFVTVAVPGKSMRGILGPDGWLLCLLALGLGVMGELAAFCIIHWIYFVTNLCFYGRFSFAAAAPSDQAIGLGVLFIPVIGGLAVGLLARYGSPLIRGHGLPEVMDSTLFHEGRIPWLGAILKPFSIGISIGTGGPFGPEAIIPTGGAMGSLLGQLRFFTTQQRRVLLAAGAAAGMSATFGAPVASVLLAIELLLFEFQPVSVVVVAIASATAEILHVVIDGPAPLFQMPPLPAPDLAALLCYAVVGLLVGLFSVVMTRGLYWVGELFKKWGTLWRIHWMWWPAAGGIAVGICGLIDARSMGIGFSNIRLMLSGKMALQTAAVLLVTRVVAWMLSLGSGNSGTIISPLFNIGSALGALLGGVAIFLLPHAGISMATAALVGMAAMFAGASWAPMTAMVFAFETTLQPNGLAPLVVGCAASFLVSCALMKDNMLTEKFLRRSGRVLLQPHADFLDRLLVRDACSRHIVCLRAAQPIGQVKELLTQSHGPYLHHLFPVVDQQGLLLGVVSQHAVLSTSAAATEPLQCITHQPAFVVHAYESLRDADNMMVRHGIGHLVVVDVEDPRQVLGVITRADILAAHRRIA